MWSVTGALVWGGVWLGVCAGQDLCAACQIAAEWERAIRKSFRVVVALPPPKTANNNDYGNSSSKATTSR